MIALLLAVALSVTAPPSVVSTPQPAIVTAPVGKSTAHIHHNINGLQISVAFPGETMDGQVYADSFTIDTGAVMTEMDSYNLVIMAMHGHAHIIAADFFAGIDGKPELYPIYIVDRIQIGNCVIAGSKDDPLLVAGGHDDLLGRTVLNRLGTYSVIQTSADDGTFAFDCPR